MRKFSTGATRSEDSSRPDFEGYLSPLVIERYGAYMQRHQVQEDGQIRDSDNWQKGMTLSSYAKGMWRHFLHWWLRRRGWPVQDPHAEPSIQDDLCAIIFNASGYLHELLEEELHARAK